MSRKKKEKLKDDKLQTIYDEEPPMPTFFNEKRSDPKPFRGENGGWCCGNESCKTEKAELFDLGEGWHACGHCYRRFNL